MTCHVGSYVCVCAACMCIYFLHPTPPTISEDHLMAAFFPLPAFVSSFSFGTLPLQEAERTVWMSYVMARFAVVLRYHVRSQLAQRLRLI